jgi:hypothetical protein
VPFIDGRTLAAPSLRFNAGVRWRIGRRARGVEARGGPAGTGVRPTGEGARGTWQGRLRDASVRARAWENVEPRKARPRDAAGGPDAKAEALARGRRGAGTHGARARSCPKPF